MAKRNILIDRDPGHDDAIALLFAGWHLDLVGVTTALGTSLANTTRNALARQFYEEVLRPGADLAGVPV
jgi:inosine-uridine nucleoside N-ribohydrolase